MKLNKDNIEEYFNKWAIEAGEVIVKKAEKEKWDYFDYSSAINFMLNDIRIDVEKLVKQLAHQFIYKDLFIIGGAVKLHILDWAIVE